MLVGLVGMPVISQPKNDFAPAYIFELIESIAQGSIENIKNELLPCIEDFKSKDIQVLRSYCAQYEHALDIAYKLHADPDLYESTIEVRQNQKEDLFWCLIMLLKEIMDNRIDVPANNYVTAQKEHLKQIYEALEKYV